MVAVGGRVVLVSKFTITNLAYAFQTPHYHILPAQASDDRCLLTTLYFVQFHPSSNLCVTTAASTYPLRKVIQSFLNTTCRNQISFQRPLHQA